MIKYFLSLSILPSLLLAQELNNDWLDTTLDKEKTLVVETTIETSVKDKDKEKINNNIKIGDSIKIDSLNQNATIKDIKGKKCFAFLEMLGATITLNIN